MNITLEQAEAIIASAKSKAEEINTKMNICVVDTGANMVAFARMDGAWLGSVDIALKKAKTAVWFTMDTAELSPLTNSLRALAWPQSLECETTRGGCRSRSHSK